MSSSQFFNVHDNDDPVATNTQSNNNDRPSSTDTAKPKDTESNESTLIKMFFDLFNANPSSEVNMTRFNALFDPVDVTELNIANLTKDEFFNITAAPIFALIKFVEAILSGFDMSHYFEDVIDSYDDVVDATSNQLNNDDNLSPTPTAEPTAYASAESAVKSVVWQIITTLKGFSNHFKGIIDSDDDVVAAASNQLNNDDNLSPTPTAEPTASASAESAVELVYDSPIVQLWNISILKDLYAFDVTCPLRIENYNPYAPDETCPHTTTGLFSGLEVLTTQFADLKFSVPELSKLPSVEFNYGELKEALADLKFSVPELPEIPSVEFNYLDHYLKHFGLAEHEFMKTLTQRESNEPAGIINDVQDGDVA